MIAFTFSRSPLNISQPLLITVAIAGTAILGTDYTFSSVLQIPTTGAPFVMIPANSSSVVLLATPIGDFTIEPNESILLSIATNNGVAVPQPIVVTATIIDDDAINLINGTGGDDYIVGTSGNDLVYGGGSYNPTEGTQTGGDDTIFGGAGNDELNTGWLAADLFAPGVDYRVLGSGFIVMTGGTGDDKLRGGYGINSLDGSSPTAAGAGEHDILIGAGQTLFYLGSADSAYYSSSGPQDYATIIGLNPATDYLQLFGERANYTTQYNAHITYVFYLGELIAKIDSAVRLLPTDACFDFPFANH